MHYLLKGTLSSSLENASASCNIAKSFANMHLSAATNGGVAFGSFSSSTNASPKFECNYPALFYNSVSCTSQSIRKRLKQAKMKRKRSLSLFCKFNVRTDT